jgi:hypothetical protein
MGEVSSADYVSTFRQFSSCSETSLCSSEVLQLVSWGDDSTGGLQHVKHLAWTAARLCLIVRNLDFQRFSQSQDARITTRHRGIGDQSTLS